MTSSRPRLSVAVERPSVPLLWLDTSILIGIVRTKQSTTKDARLVDLERLVTEKQRAKKLLCVESDQPYEVEGHRGASAIRRSLRTLSYALRLRPRLDLDAFQVAEGMRAYLSGSTRIELPRRAFFDEEPDRVLAEVHDQGWFLTVDSDLHPELRTRAKQVKDATYVDLETLRLENRANRIGYGEQLERERRGFLTGQRVLAERRASELRKRDPDPLVVFAGTPLSRYLRIWTTLGGDPNSGLEFFESDHFLSLPCNDIQHRLYAQVLTIDRPIESGDAMDIQHMTAALPTARWVLTDRSLANRVRQLGLDAAWGSTVYSLRELDALMAQLEVL